MAAFHRASRERVNVFPIKDRFYFRRFFEDNAIFATLAPYYNDERYRFEIPPDRYETIANTLRSHEYEPVVVEDFTPFVVGQRRYSDHPRILFRSVVAQRSMKSYTLFLLKDRKSVEQAIDAGATPVSSLEISWPRSDQEGAGDRSHIR